MEKKKRPTDRLERVQHFNGPRETTDHGFFGERTRHTAEHVFQRTATRARSTAHRWLRMFYFLDCLIASRAAMGNSSVGWKNSVAVRVPVELDAFRYRRKTSERESATGRFYSRFSLITRKHAANTATLRSAISSTVFGVPNQRFRNDGTKRFFETSSVVGGTKNAIRDGFSGADGVAFMEIGGERVTCSARDSTRRGASDVLG